MSYTYHGISELIALPNRTVQTYPGGLVRVERSFICRKGDVDNFRNQIKVNESMPFDTGAPAIDGLYIFPEPQEIVRDDGFVEFRVTAYGRTSEFADSPIERSSIKSQYFIEDFTGEELVTFSLPSINDVFIIRGVVPLNTPTVNLLTKPLVLDPSVIPLSSFNNASTPLVAGKVSGPQTVSVDGVNYPVITITTIAIGLDSYASTNFGLFSEYIITWKAGASILRYA